MPKGQEKNIRYSSSMVSDRSRSESGGTRLKRSELDNKIMYWGNRSLALGLHFGDDLINTSLCHIRDQRVTFMMPRGTYLG